MILSTLLVFVAFFVPTFIVVRKLKLDINEKIVFSLLIGMGLFPTAVYYFALLIGSMRYSIFVCFVVLTAVAFFVSSKIHD